MLAGKAKRAWHILQQLKQEDCEPVILLRTLQRELLQLLALKRRMSDTPLRTLFDQQKCGKTDVTCSHRHYSGSLQQLQQAVRLLTQVEITLKQDYGQSVWSELESLAMLLCGKALPEAFI